MMYETDDHLKEAERNAQLYALSGTTDFEVLVCSQPVSELSLAEALALEEPASFIIRARNAYADMTPDAVTTRNEEEAVTAALRLQADIWVRYPPSQGTAWAISQGKRAHELGPVVPRRPQ